MSPDIVLRSNPTDAVDDRAPLAAIPGQRSAADVRSKGVGRGVGSARRLAAMVDASPVAMAFVSPDLRLTVLNRTAAADLVGFGVSVPSLPSRADATAEVLGLDESLLRETLADRSSRTRSLQLRRGTDTVDVQITPTSSGRRGQDGLLVTWTVATSRLSQEAARIENLADTSAVNTVLGAMAGARTLDEAAQVAVDTVRDAFGWAYASYWSVRDDDALHFVLESGDAGAEFRRVTLEASFREGVGLSGRAWRTRDLFFTRDIGDMTDCVRAPAAKRAGVKSGVCFPILVRDEVVGTMDFFATETLDPSEERLDALRNVGRLVSAALERISREEALRQTVESLTDAAARLTTVSKETGTNAQRSSDSANGALASQAQVSDKLQNLSSAIDALTESIGEIARNASAAASVADEAVGVAAGTRTTVTSLGDSSAEIGDVVETISAIAKQTQVLALNATIEASRAGDAGKGFNVVANEVKELAKETARATSDIGARIRSIQTVTDDAVRAITEIGDIIDRISDSQTSIAAAVEEQRATTSEIAMNVTLAAESADGITADIAEVADVAKSTDEASAGTLASADQLAEAAHALSRLLG